MRILGVILVLTVAALGSIQAQTPVPITGEFVLSTTFAFDVDDPEVTPAGTGFVATWSETGETSSDIIGRRIAASGAPVDDPFRVNAAAAISPRASIAGLVDGRFAVSVDTNTSASNPEIFARVYSSAARPERIEQPLDTQRTGDQLVSRIAPLPNGRWVVAWGDGGTPNRVVAHIVDSAGVPVGSEIVVSSAVSFNGVALDVATDSTGRMAFVWGSDGANGDGDQTGVIARIFSPDGAPVTGQFVVNDFVSGTQGSPRATFLADGTLLVTWIGANPDDSTGVSFRRLSLTGARIGPQTTANTFRADLQILARVTALADGGWVIAWTGRGQDGDRDGVFAQRFSSDGQPSGLEFALNLVTFGDQRRGAIAANGNRLLAVWQSADVFGSALVVGRMFLLPSPEPPKARPVVKVTGKPPRRTESSQFRLRGTATGDARVARVLVSLNGGNFKRAQGTNSWRFTVRLKSGRNVIVIKSVDGAGLESRPLRVVVQRR